MNTATPQRPAPRPIKGSWEDLHAQAQKHARNYNDEAIPIYQRVFNGLLALPPAAREAGDRRLYNLMMVTGVELQGYLNLRERYEESLAVIDKMHSTVADADKPQLVELKSDVLIQSERGDEAVAILRQLAEGDDADAADWGKIIAAYIRLKQAEKALPVVDEMGTWIDAQIESGALQGDEAREAKFYKERLRAAALMELGRIDETITLFNDLYAQDGANAFSPHMLYTRLAHEGRYEDALRYIDRDQARPVRASFWRGLVNYYQGDQAKATRIWEAATKEEVVRSDTESIVEHILTHYYLGDQKGEGIEIVLRTQREQQRISWMVFLLTGLGWLVRNNSANAHSNFKLAVAQVKSMGEGKTLPNHYWRFVRDLTPAGEVAQYAQYFDTQGDVPVSDAQVSDEPADTPSGTDSADETTPTPSESGTDQ